MIDAKIRACKAEIRDGKAFLEIELANPEDINEFIYFIKQNLSNTYVRIDRAVKKSPDLRKYLWVLCDLMAKELSIEGVIHTKNDIYRQIIREVGVWFDGTYEHELYKDLADTWSKNGLGWFSEPLYEDSNGITARFYKGMSAYSGRELLRLVGYAVQMTEELGIATDRKERGN